MPKPTKDDERRLLAHVADVCRLVDDGSSPNEAITKIASDNHLPVWQIRLMVNAYNNGRTNEQRRSSNELFDKVAEFEVADPACIIKAIYPEKIKTAAELDREEGVAEEYSHDADWAHDHYAKAASHSAPEWHDDPVPELPRDQTRFDKRLRGMLHKLADERTRLYTQLDGLHDKIASAYDQLDYYFRQPDALPLEDVRINSEAFWGPAGEAAINKMAAMCGGPAMPKPTVVHKPSNKKEEPKKPVPIKRAAAVVTRHRMRHDQAPYCYLAEIIKTAAEYNQAFRDAESFEKIAWEAQLKLERALAFQPAEPQPLPADCTLSIVRRLGGEKRAIAGASTIGEGAKLMLGAEAAKSIMKKLSPESNHDVKQDAYSDVSDPSHEAKLRAIRAQSALHGILNSQYFEGEDPHHVTRLFNDLTRMYPRMAEQPLLLETAMKRLAAQGSADAHDLDQLLGIETKLKQRDAVPTGTSQIVETVYPKAVGPQAGGGSQE